MVLGPNIANPYSKGSGLLGPTRLTSKRLSTSTSSAISSPADAVCGNCSDLDLPGIFAGGFVIENGFISRKSQPFARWLWQKAENCQFCNFLERASALRRTSPWFQRDNAHLKLRWLKREPSELFNFDEEEVILRLAWDPSISEDSGHLHRNISYWDQVLLGCSASDDYLGLQQRDCSIGVVTPYIESLETLRNSITICEKSHSCLTSSKDMREIPSVPARVIDCTSRQVVTAPRACRYLALSYVWGDSKKPPSVKIGETLPVLPQTIEDAIAVTSSLGFQYLWVDMYCILQDNDEDVGNQIRHMDLVYRRAQATIIAAAGSDPTFGLPGVSSVRGIHQASVKMEGISLATFPYDPWMPVRNSNWENRAWTFQEGLFSPRRIFFTAEQIIFNCSVGWHCKTIRPTQRIKVTGAINSLNFWPSFWSPQCPDWAIFDLIEKYSSRQLTFTGDILNAFLGVLRAAENLPSPVRHHWGIPILSPERGALGSFIFGLLWTFTQWKPQKMRRRDDFPSWSWLGWERPVIYRERYTEPTRYLPPPDFCVSIELLNGSTISWAEFERALTSDRSPLPTTKFLTIEGWTVPVKLKFLKRRHFKPTMGSFFTVYADFGAESQSGSCFDIHVNNVNNGPNDAEYPEVEGVAKVYNGIGIPLHCHSKVNHRYPILILVQRDSFWERVGVSFLDSWQAGQSLIKLEQRKIRLG
ncbi:HET-domain-containing protein [Hyaloscypha bicolor E]|uniref:HET-domain-containing protein n=1 Tax=Hyaloscypha bicolor E TaxID=1095630 RepID=A0A2J6SG01_9HELO|nr:HET-domain-containing protein [Hyaloscypha bicolor E]PMD49679.1 HET-domain-containing protein [Hyaloscypha bicolor E]